MSKHPNYLRLYRKRSPLTQSDIAFLMGLSDYSNISRYEKGQRTPSVEILLTYHHLFTTPMESFFERHSEELLIPLKARLEELISKLVKEETNPVTTSRAKYLEEILIRLTN